MDDGLSGWHPPWVIFVRPSIILPVPGWAAAVWLGVGMVLITVRMGSKRGCLPSRKRGVCL